MSETLPNRGVDAARRMPSRQLLGCERLAIQGTRDVRQMRTVSFIPADVLDFPIAKIMVKEMMRDGLAQYHKHWKGLGREPPSEEEWYKTADAQEQGESEEMLEAVTDEDSGYPVAE